MREEAPQQEKSPDELSGESSGNILRKEIFEEGDRKDDLPPLPPNIEADPATWEEYNKKREEWEKRQDNK